MFPFALQPLWAPKELFRWDVSPDSKVKNVCFRVENKKWNTCSMIQCMAANLGFVFSCGGSYATLKCSENSSILEKTGVPLWCWKYCKVFLKILFAKMKSILFTIQMHIAKAVTRLKEYFLAFLASSAIKNGIAEVAKKKQLSWVMFSHICAKHLLSKDFIVQIYPKGRYQNSRPTCSYESILTILLSILDGIKAWIIV